jgi:type VI secretion system protein ImpM
MRCGLFGKLSAKRDFIALATPRNFLEAWEPWVQASLSASRHQLGDRWQQAFLTTPVWRFWLGSAICGSTVAGAIMPSLDGVGRYYPLTLHAVGDTGAPIVPPDIDAQAEWFDMSENFLLSTLDREMAFEEVSSALDHLPVPRTQPPGEGDGRVVRLGERMAGMISAADGFSASLSCLRAASPEVYAAASFWWTNGGADFPPLVLSCRGLPDPYQYSTLLSGNLGEIAAVG